MKEEKEKSSRRGQNNQLMYNKNRAKKKASMNTIVNDLEVSNINNR